MDPPREMQKRIAYLAVRPVEALAKLFLNFSRSAAAPFLKAAAMPKARHPTPGRAMPLHQNKGVGL
jgi:hypothetical protein